MTNVLRDNLFWTRGESLKVAYIGFPQWRRLPRKIAHMMERLEMTDRFEMILERFAADGNPVLDHHPRFGGGQRVARDRVRCIGQFDILGAVEVVEAVRSLRPQPVELGLLGGDLP
jgi:hypothetical protein